MKSFATKRWREMRKFLRYFKCLRIETTSQDDDEQEEEED